MGLTCVKPLAMSVMNSGALTGTDVKEEVPEIYRSPIVFCVFILVLEFYVYNLIYLGRILPAIGKAELVPCFAAIFNFFWLLTVWCYTVVRTSDPGSCTDQWRAFVTNTAGLDVIISRQEWQPGKVTTNKKSVEIRPERSHFCSTIRRDVLRMDHFCPWTGNCIGIGNHKHFLLLGMYGALAGTAAVATSFTDLAGCMMGYGANAYVWESVPAADRGLFLTFGLFAVLTMLLLTGLVTSHFPLACRNMTTIEELYTNMPNPYDQQNWFQNLEQVLGGVGWDWLLPVAPRHPKSDGCSYRRNGEVLPEGLVEVYGRDILKYNDDTESALHKLPEDIWFFRYTGQTRGAHQQNANVSTSWFAWLGGY